MKTILHLCADIGSDSKPYRDAGYNVICVGEKDDVRSYVPPDNVYGVIANPPSMKQNTRKLPDIGLSVADRRAVAPMKFAQAFFEANQ